MREDTSGYPLSPRQREVVKLAAEGLGETGIAQRLGIATATVRQHYKDIKLRLGARNMVEAVTLAIRTGQVE